MGIQAISSTAAIDLTALSQAQAAKKEAPAEQAEQTGQAASRRPAGPPPARGGANMTAPSSTASESTETTEESSTSSAAVIYDKRDANQDGVVSYQEEMLYSIKHPAQQTEQTTQAQTAATPSQLQSGLKAYQQGQQGNSTLNSSLILAG